VATTSGLALLAGDTAHLYLLDQDLAVTQAPIDLGLSFWFYASLAATDTQVAVSLAVPYGSYAFLIKDQQVLSKTPIGEGGKDGVAVSLVADHQAFTLAWRVSIADEPLHYRSDIADDQSSDLVWHPGASGPPRSRMVRVGSRDLVAWIGENDGPEIQLKSVLVGSVP
jgi:hypothetical protein